MATYQTGTTLINYNWANVIGNTLVNSAGTFNSTSFFVADSDGNRTKVTGTGFTYNAGTTAVTGGIVTGLQRYVGGVPNGEQITGASVSASAFWADLGSAKLAAVLNGADTFKLSQTQLNGANGSYAINGYDDGLNTLTEAGLTSDSLVFDFTSPAFEALHDQTTNITIELLDITGFTGGSGKTTFSLAQNPVPVTLTGGTGLSVVEMSFTNLSPFDYTPLDLRTQTISNIDEIQFNNTLIPGGDGIAVVELGSDQIGGSGFASNLVLRGEIHLNPILRDVLLIEMKSSSFDVSGFTADAAWTNSNGILVIDGSALSGNLTMTGGSVAVEFVANSGNDTLKGAVAGAGSTAEYSQITTPGVVAIMQGGAGTVNKGGSNGIDHLTHIQRINGSTGNDVFYLDSAGKASGQGGFDYLIELSSGVNLTYGTNFDGISEFVSNIGNNTVDFSADTDIAYLYGSTGNDTLTLGTGGGYLIGEGGTNVLNGGGGATNVFVGGSGGTNIMNGGHQATNYYYIENGDQVNGDSLSFNEIIELASGVTIQLGSSQYQNIQGFVANGGNNTVTVASTDLFDFIYLFGGVGNDTLTTGAGGGYLIGEGGTNVLTGGDGVNVFVADNASGVDIMNGGSGSNVYYIDHHSTVHGAGTFNTVVELEQNVSLTLGSSQLGTDVQQVVFNNGINSADFHTATTQVYLYGGIDDDTLYGGSGNDFLFGNNGANTFKFGAGWGKDTIDWNFGIGNTIDLTALASLGVHSIADLTQTIVNGNDVITSSHTGTNSITLKFFDVPLTASSFHFA